MNLAIAPNPIIIDLIATSNPKDLNLVIVIRARVCTRVPGIWRLAAQLTCIYIFLAGQLQQKQ